MPNPTCTVCGKVVYPLEAVPAGGVTYHKACFKCHVCKATLNLKNFKAHSAQVYCNVHTPKEKHTQVGDVTLQSTSKAQKANEYAKRTQLATAKGAGDKPTQVADSLATKQAMNAPKVKSGFVGVRKADPKSQHRVASFESEKSSDAGVFESSQAQSASDAGSGYGGNQVQSGVWESDAAQSSSDAGHGYGNANVESGVFESNAAASSTDAGIGFGSQQVESGEWASDAQQSSSDAGVGFGNQSVESGEFTGGEGGYEGEVQQE
jgi:hypothetical protein